MQKAVTRPCSLPLALAQLTTLASCQLGEAGPTEEPPPAVQRLLAADLPEDELPADFDGARGEGTYLQPDGSLVTFITGGDDELEDGHSTAADAGAPPPPSNVPGVMPWRAADTWARLTPAGANDHGRSCELRVGPFDPKGESAVTLVKIRPSKTACAGLKSASLIMTTAQLPTVRDLAVHLAPAGLGWSPGTSGGYICRRCYVLSGRMWPFFMPPFTPGRATLVDRPCQRYSWDVTELVRSWCESPSTNNGVVLSGGQGDATVSFHSLQSAEAHLRPRLRIVH